MPEIVFVFICAIICVCGVICIGVCALEAWDNHVGQHQRAADDFNKKQVELQEYRKRFAGYRRYATMGKRPDLRVVNEEGE